MRAVTDELTFTVKKEIKKQYRSVRAFSAASGIPYTTLTNALKKGIGKTAYDTVMKILMKLNLSDINRNEMYSDKLRRLGIMYRALDEQGENVVERVLRAEFARCRYEDIKRRAAEADVAEKLADAAGLPEQVREGLADAAAAECIIEDIMQNG